MLKQPTVLWHYTIADRFERIMADGFIKPATAGVHPDEKPLVWFSANPIFEQTARKVCSWAGLLPWPQCTEAVPHIRIGFQPDVAPLHWSQIKRRLRRSIASGLEEVARKQGAKPWEWWGSPEKVPLNDNAIAVEMYEAGAWTSILASTPR